MRLRAYCALQAQAEGQKYQIEALTAQLEHLMASKSQLESRCQLLEKVVKMREAPAPNSPQVPPPLYSKGCIATSINLHCSDGRRSQVSAVTHTVG